MRTVIGVALKQNEQVTFLLPPKRHGDVFRLINLEKGDVEQGFIDNRGNYLSREEAWFVAQEAGQLLERAPTDKRGGTLYSEDVW